VESFTDQKIASDIVTRGLLACPPERKVRHMSVGAIRRFRLAVCYLTTALVVLTAFAFLAPGLVWPVAISFCSTTAVVAVLLLTSVFPSFLREQRDLAVALREHAQWRSLQSLLRHDRISRIYPAMREGR